MKSMRFLLALLLCLALCLSLSPAAWAADAAVKAPVINGQPKDLTVGENGSGKFTVQASGSALKYQWQYAEGNAWKDCTESGGNTASLSVRGDADADGREYRCIVSNEGGSVGAAASIHATPKTSAAPKMMRFMDKGGSFLLLFRAGNTGEK